jgi:hypothetical protein
VESSIESAFQQRTVELAKLLLSARTVYTAMWNSGFFEPNQEHTSSGGIDFRMLMMGPGGMWLLDLNTLPRDIAVKLTHQQADYCFALGLIIGAAGTRDPAATLVRSTVEYTARTLWLVNPADDHRAHCCRAFLLELVSLQRSINAAQGMPNLASEVATHQGQLDDLKADAASRFNRVHTPSKVDGWMIEEQRLPSLTGTVNAWADAHESDVDGVSLYRTLSASSHPQGFSATAGLAIDEDGAGVRVPSLKVAENHAQTALAAFYSSLALVANYNAQRTAELAEWEEQLARIMPASFRNAPART